MTEPDVWKLADDYLNEAIQIGAVEERLLDIEPSQETELSRRLIGLFAEASHAHWTENELREELGNVLRLFASHVYK